MLHPSAALSRKTLLVVFVREKVPLRKMITDEVRLVGHVTHASLVLVYVERTVYIVQCVSCLLYSRSVFLVHKFRFVCS